MMKNNFLKRISKQKYIFAIAGLIVISLASFPLWSFVNADLISFENRHAIGQPKFDNWTQDAYYHALSSYVASIRFGEDFAKDWGDIQERENQNPKGIQLMNLYNNAIGRELARDTQNHLRKPEDVIDDAFKNDLLKTEPFKVKVENK